MGAEYKDSGTRVNRFGAFSYRFDEMAVLMAERVSLGRRVALLRKRGHLTQRELAERVGVSPQTISNWENEVSQIPSPDVPTVAGAFGISVAELYDERPIAGVSRPASRDLPTPLAEATYDPDPYNVTPLGERVRRVRPLPIYRWGSMGDPTDHDSSPHPDREEYPPAGRENLIGSLGFGVEVRGESMVGRDLHDGDVCWINPERTYRVGDLVLALSTNGNGDSGMVIKTYTRTEDGDCLMSEGAHGKLPVVCAEFKIIGPVVGIQRWFPPR